MSKELFQNRKLERPARGFLEDRKAQTLADELNDLLKMRRKDSSVEVEVTTETIHTLGKHNKVPYVRSILANYVGIERDEDDDLYRAVSSGGNLPESVQKHLELRLCNSVEEQTSFALGYLMSKESAPYLIPHTVKTGNLEKTIHLNPYYDIVNRF